MVESFMILDKEFKGIKGLHAHCVRTSTRARGSYANIMDHLHYKFFTVAGPVVRFKVMINSEFLSHRRVIIYLIMHQHCYPLPSFT